MPSSSKNAFCSFLIVCSALLLCFTEVASQSGRRTKKTTDPVSVPVNSQETTEPKPVAGPITSIIIGGHDIDPDTEGRVFPAKQKASADPGGILRLPKRTGSKSNPRLLEQGGEDIADRVKGIL